jgi:uncharacterized membrane protein
MARGEAPDAARLSLAAERGRHNAALVAPLLFTMLAAHGTYLASVPFGLTAAIVLTLGVSALVFRAPVRD